MAECELEQLKSIELEILDEFLRICSAYDIDFRLIGGSCLGAVRHGGFIPWDDDIDIGMLRSDYQRFADIAKRELSKEFVFQNYHTEPQCGLVFGKIRKQGTTLSEVYSRHIDMSQGVWIDIFPYDFVPDAPAEQKRAFSRVQLLKNLYIVQCGYEFPVSKSPILKPAFYIAKSLMRFYPQQKLINSLEHAMTKFNQVQSAYIFPYGGAYGMPADRLSLDQFCDHVQIDFEGRNCRVFKDYDSYLSALYGSYMELPPKEDRVGSAHTIYEFRA